MFPENNIGETRLYRFFYPDGEETEVTEGDTETDPESETEVITPDARLEAQPDLWLASGHEDWIP